MSQWYEELFTDYAEKYDQENYTQGTAAEVEFIESEISHDRSRKILDIGCGTGRHAIELAQRGYLVTGLDLSDSQLERARKKAAAAGVKVTFLKRDARDFRFEEPFDVAIMLCEGAFSLMETDAMNFQILANAGQALKPGGLFIFTCLNALFPLHQSVQNFINENSANESVYVTNSFDLMTFRNFSTIKVIDDHGIEKKLNCNERYYAPAEITWLLRSLKFSTIDIFGCAPGDYQRGRELTSNDFEMLVVAKK
jgi:2-polyprenyl-3-methyl-5-hydroxy-6-metoxy-1,4-benzoquinol methylase